MNSRDLQMLELAKSLLQKTVQGRVSWRRTDRVGRYLYVGNTVSVILEGPAGLLRQSSFSQYSLLIVDSGGNTLDSVEAGANKSLAVAAAALNDPSHAELRQAIQPVLAQLFGAVEEYVSKPSPEVDDLIREIEGK